MICELIACYASDGQKGSIDNLVQLSVELLAKYVFNWNSDNLLDVKSTLFWEKAEELDKFGSKTELVLS